MVFASEKVKLNIRLPYIKIKRH